MRERERERDRNHQIIETTVAFQIIETTVPDRVMMHA